MEEAIDKNDPNYDSDSLDNEDIVLEPIIHEPSDEELKVMIIVNPLDLKLI